jgi:hypothetical protein
MVATFYGADGKVLYVDSFSLPSIHEGGWASFIMAVDDPARAALVTNYQIVESPAYTSISELTSTWNSLGSSADDSCVAIRRKRLESYILSKLRRSHHKPVRPCSPL